MSARRVLVMRAAHQAGKLSDALRDAGFEPVEVPILEIRPPLNPGPLDAALRNLKSYDRIILTSANTVHAVVRRATALHVVLPGTAGPPVAAIGDATAAAARDAGLIVSLVPEKYVAESLIAALADQVTGQRILLARAEMARDVLPDALRAAGATIHVVDAYRNVLPAAAPNLLRSAVEQGIDAAAFTSSSSVTHLAEAARAAGIPFPMPNVAAISIGPITSATLREHNWEPAIEAEPSNIPGLVNAFSKSLKQDS